MTATSDGFPRDGVRESVGIADGTAGLSPVQQRLWFLNRFQEGRPGQTRTLSVRLGGALDLSALRAALGAIVQRHRVLGTVHREVEGRCRPEFRPPERTFTALRAEPVSPARLNRVLAQAAGEGMDLTAECPLRVRLLGLAPDDHVLVLVVHEIAADERSLTLLAEELAGAYAEAVRTGGTPRTEPGPQYAEVAAAAGTALGDPQVPDSRAAEQLAYWRDTLDGAPEQLQLPLDRPRPAATDYRSTTYHGFLDAALHRKLDGLARDAGVPLDAVLLAGVSALLHRFGAGTDIPLAVSLPGRADAGSATVIGPLANTAVVRTSPAPGHGFRALVRDCATANAAARRHSAVPFEQVVDALRPERALNRHPLAQVAVEVREAETARRPFGPLTARITQLPAQHCRFDLRFGFRMRAGTTTPDGTHGIDLIVDFGTELFMPATVRRMTDGLLRLLRAAADAPDEAYTAYDVLGPEERQRLLSDWNATARPVPGAGVSRLFEERVRHHGDRTALVCGATRLTYAQLDARANRLARALVDGGARPGTLVALALPRGPELVVALLATAKAGAAYIPLDPEYPADRIGYILGHAAPSALITDDATARRLSGAPDRVFVLDDPALRDRLAALPGTALAPDELPATATGADPAYVIYTSGSTGRPKGVAVGRRALTNFLVSMGDLFPLTGDDVWLSVTTIAFDIAALELYLPLISGAAVVLADRETTTDPGALARLLTASGATIMQATPSLWQALCEAEPEALRGLRMLVGGEALPSALAERMRALGSEVTNLYGPTETTIWSTAARLDDRPGPPTIGRPIGNTRVYVLDADRQPVPVGVTGDLYIAGAGVAIGYLHQEELTRERFVPDPFAPGMGVPPAEGWGRMYRTGDLARWAADGNLEFLGRSDFQVKIRGFRIELGEIEAVLERHPGVGKAVAVAHAYGPGDTRLVAYVAPGGADAAELRAFAGTQLPAYMVPATVVALDEIPLTPNGKTDRAALPAPGADAAPRGRGPRIAREEQLCDLFSEVLGLSAVGVDDSFFDLGGHSLLATRLIGRIRAVLGVEVSIRALFETPTVAGLAGRLDGARARETGLKPVGRDGDLPLSYGQQRLWFLYDYESQGSEYNSAFGLRLTGPLDVPALRSAISALVARHEALRTTFGSRGGQGVQIVHEPGEVPVRVIGLAGADAGPGADGEDREAALTRVLRTALSEPFDLRAGPVLRPLLVRVAEEDHVLVLDMHHIVTDGWSKDVMARELGVLYEAAHSGRTAELPPLPVQYPDFAVWQRAPRADAYAADLDYWKRQLDGVVPLEMPTDRPRPATRSTRGAAHRYTLRPGLVTELTALCWREGVTLFATLAAGVQLLLSRYGRQQDIALGTIVSGRDHSELENVLGFFVNTLVLRARVRPELTVAEFLAEVRGTVLDAFTHQNVPYDRLIEELRPDRDPSRTPLIQAAMLLKRPQGPVPGPDGLRMAEFGLPRLNALFDLGFEFEERDGELAGLIEYSTALFDEETVARLARHLVVLLENMAAGPQRSLGQLPMMDEAERRQVTSGWNATDAAGRAHRTTVHQLVAEQAARTPDATAVVTPDTRLTFAELEDAAGRLAHRLLAHGVRPGEVVAVRTGRGAEMVIAQLAVLKAGAAYLPLDPALPDDRTTYMLRDASVRLLLVRGGPADLPVPEGVTVLRVEDESDGEAPPAGPVRVPVSAGDLAYVIYTSGSTGRAKGVLIEHRGVINLCDWYRDYYRIGPGDRASQIVGPGFDPTILEVWANLACGASVHFAPQSALDDPHEFADWLVAEGITVTLVPAPRLDSVLDQRALWHSALRYVLTGADVVRRRLPADAPFTLVNQYGPTEITVLATAVFLEPEDEAAAGRLPSIGAPVTNTRTYVLDEHRDPVPVGVPGELYIGGIGVARGYLGRPELTKERFVPDHLGPDPDGRLYRTGDLVRWLPDGTLDFLGRIDNQVKIRGYRVELGEVETALLREESVAQAVVLARQQRSGHHDLVGYVTGQGDGAIDPEAVRARLAAGLPDYMVPSVLVVLDAFPMTTTGKIDRRALPLPEERAAAVAETTAPRDPTEEALARMWAEVLGEPVVGVEDDLFDLGANSVLTLQITSRIRERFGIRVSVREIFTARTVAALAEDVRRKVLDDSRRVPADTTARGSARGE
ncbi:MULTISPECIES: non-ribosomal peptide synthetase [Streptomyces]|uniref:Non-ribosomal peptide synthetase n=6 Tax=Streptomyces rimosus TaxID=1927 RepID=A0A8A1UV07_STRR1|nr:MULTISPECIES: non-ribosomal peptide synthetase [Streptomyces]MYT44361.1 non-ribosomal peptide synthetase [Streptomyces sp. SID5471]QDA03960.1 non-ribosomal peptide synthetase [Streptomyces rimosus]QEV75243.1 non-ribosomal peptide synthetase [Streptomyces rimosus]QGY67820.1 non-ribosomal peptide synthetase [Streptomyces rimosus R6-500]QST84010.1 non-ribosomal peptide synthetase [Streptomyces rimosus subsp. rimosus ATCC 10970]